MLFYDASESRKTSKLPSEVIEHGYLWEGVEAETGADFVITPDLSKTHKVVLMSQKMTLAQIAKQLDMSMMDVAKAKSASEDLSKVLYEYLYRGAIAVQRKSGNDLVASIKDKRIESSVARLYRAVPHRCQRVLLYTGNIIKRNGNVYVNGKDSGIAYQAFVMALTSWANRGGVLIHLDGDNDILPWIKLVEQKLTEYQHRDTKEIYTEVYFPPEMPDEDDTLQIPIEVTDWRRTLVTIPGIGPDKVSALYERLQQICTKPPTLTVAVQYAMSEDAAETIHGWGPKSTESVRHWFGLADDERLMILVDEET